MLAPTLLVLWVLAAPFLAGSLIARSPSARRSVARVYALALAAGWLGLGLLAAGAHLLDGPAAAAALAVGGPLAGLSFWSRQVDDDGGDDRPTEDDDPPLPGDGLDWDSFESEFREYARQALGAQGSLRPSGSSRAGSGR
jgi:hypothetical protein